MSKYRTSSIGFVFTASIEIFYYYWYLDIRLLSTKYKTDAHFFFSNAHKIRI